MGLQRADEPTSSSFIFISCWTVTAGGRSDYFYRGGKDEVGLGSDEVTVHPRISFHPEGTGFRLEEFFL